MTKITFFSRSMRVNYFLRSNYFDCDDYTNNHKNNETNDTNNGLVGS